MLFLKTFQQTAEQIGLCIVGLVEYLVERGINARAYLYTKLRPMCETIKNVFICFKSK